MKISFLLVLLIAAVYSGEIAAEEKDADNIPGKKSRNTCLKPGEECTNTCQCCSKVTYCKCPLGGFFGCSCVYGDSMVCLRKRKECKGYGSDIVDNPPGSCFTKH
nr:venom protein [Lampona murina]